MAGAIPPNKRKAVDMENRLRDFLQTTLRGYVLSENLTLATAAVMRALMEYDPDELQKNLYHTDYNP